MTEFAREQLSSKIISKNVTAHGAILTSKDLPDALFSALALPAAARASLCFALDSLSSLSFSRADSTIFLCSSSRFNALDYNAFSTLFI
jgi:hypothetical protein